jgi:hypothetical protein
MKGLATAVSSSWRGRWEGVGGVASTPSKIPAVRRLGRSMKEIASVWWALLAGGIGAAYGIVVPFVPTPPPPLPWWVGILVAIAALLIAEFVVVYRLVTRLEELAAPQGTQGLPQVQPSNTSITSGGLAVQHADEVHVHNYYQYPPAPAVPEQPPPQTPENGESNS